MKRIGLLLLLAMAVAVAGMGTLHAQEPPPVDPNKMSPLGSKTFDVKTIELGNTSDLMKSAPGFDKTLSFGSSPLGDKTAVLGGREIYAPSVDFNKTFATSDSPLFKGISPLSSQVSTLADKTSPLSGAANLPQFSRILDDKMYQGREASLVREAMDRLDMQSGTALTQEMAANASAQAGVKPPAPVNSHETTQIPAKINRTEVLLTPDDVRMLINKDVAPASLTPPVQNSSQ